MDEIKREHLILDCNNLVYHQRPKRLAALQQCSLQVFKQLVSAPSIEISQQG
jgi:hypothetical protein